MIAVAKCARCGCWIRALVRWTDRWELRCWICEDWTPCG